MYDMLNTCSLHRIEQMAELHNCLCNTSIYAVQNLWKNNYMFVAQHTIETEPLFLTGANNDIDHAFWLTSLWAPNLYTAMVAVY